MKVLWPFGVALRGEASNHLMLRWLKTVVVSDEGKGRTRCVRWGPGRRARANRCRSVVTRSDGIKTGALGVAPGRAWRVPVYWPGGARRGGGASPVCGFHAERGKADAGTACWPCGA